MLPMAIDRDMVCEARHIRVFVDLVCSSAQLMAVALNPPRKGKGAKPSIVIAHIDSKEFAGREFDPAEAVLEMDGSSHAWHKYAQAGIKGVLEEFKVAEPAGFTVLCDGTVRGSELARPVMC